MKKIVLVIPDDIHVLVEGDTTKTLQNGTTFMMSIKEGSIGVCVRIKTMCKIN